MTQSAVRIPRRLLAAASLALGAAALPGTASALFTVNFDQDGDGGTILNGQIIDYEYANGGIVDSDTGATVGMKVDTENSGGGPDYGVAFDTSASNTRDPDLEAPFKKMDGSPHSDPALSSPGNILIVQENSTGCGDGVCNEPDDEAGGPNTFTFMFSDAVTLFSVDIFDVDADNQNETVEFSFSNAAGALGNSPVTNFGTGGNNTSQRVEFGSGIMNVSQLEVVFSSSGAMSNIRGEVPQDGVPPASEVPEPGTLGLLALALAGAWRARRRG